MGKYFYLFTLTILSSVSIFAQKATKEALLNEQLYKKNISIYRAILKEGTNKEVSLKLAEALRHIGSYKQSAAEYAKVMDRPDLNPIYYKNYSDVLAQIGQKEESQRWHLRFKEYEKRADKLSDAHVYIDTGAYFINRAPFNSLETDFGPTFYRNGILYVSAFSPEKKNPVHEGTGESFYEFFYAERTDKNNFAQPTQVFKGINTTEYEGPVGLNKKCDSLYFIKSNLVQLKVRSKDKGIKMQLVKGSILQDEITDIQPLAFNDGIHSFSNPTLSTDEKEMYFVANLDSVHGSIDIYKSELENGIWSKPENLGPVVNSSADEMYPFMTKSEKLYFSSMRPGGLGALDIYVTEKKEGKWMPPKHLPAPINSIFDDFSFIEDEDLDERFFASNRAESLGSDDIFSCSKAFPSSEDQAKLEFKKISLINKDYFIAQKGNKIKGMLKRNNDSVDFNGVVVQLLDKNQQVVRRCYVAKDGYFSFSNLPPDNYLIVYEHKQADASPQIYIAHKSAEFIDLEDLVKYKLAEIQKDSLSANNSNIVVGSLHSNSIDHAKDGNVSLLLVKSDGAIVKRITASTQHFFIFKNLLPDHYFVVTEDHNPYYGCGIQYKYIDKVTQVVEKDWFKYKRFRQDSSKDVNVIVHGKIKDNYVGTSTILLLDSNDRVVRQTTSNAGGYFVFRELGKEDLHMVVLNQNRFASYEYTTVNQAEDSVFEISRQGILRKMLMSEESIGEKLVVNGRLTAEGKPVQDKLVLLVDKKSLVVKQTHSNADGFFTFRKLKPDDFYIIVDEDKTPYVMERNFSLEDTSLLIRESDFHQFEKKKHSFFAVKGTAFKKSDKSPVENKLVLLTDTNGKVIRQTWVSKDGSFTFTNLQPDNYLVVFQQYDPEEAAEVRLIQDEATKLVQVENGKTVTYSLPIVKEANKTVVFFDLRSDKVGKKYHHEFHKILASVKESTPKRIEVVGYADLSGNAEYNLNLSERRAQNSVVLLKKLLAKYPEIEIVDKPLGATSQFTNTYGAYIPALNRRAEIFLIKN